MGLWHFIVQHAYGDKETLPDHSRLAWMLALITINQDLSIPVLYTAIITTSYGCDFFKLYGIYYGLSQANFLMPIVCGWTVDLLGKWSHIVLIVLAVFLSVMQIATLVTTSIWLLGAIFLVRLWLLNQAVVQSYKLMAIRTHKCFKDDEDKKEQECQRTGGTADFWTSAGEIVCYAIVYFIPDTIGRYALVIMAVSNTVIVAIICLTYSSSDLTTAEPEGDDASDSPASTSPNGTRRPKHVKEESEALMGTTTTPCCTKVGGFFSCKKGAPLYRFGVYLLGAKEFFTSFLIAIPFMHYLLLQTFRVMVTLPLNQNEAGLLTSLVPGVCDGTIKNIYFQGFFSQVFYLIGSLLYLRFVALLSPYSYFLYMYPFMAILFGGLATIFYLPNVSVYWGATVLAIMNTASYYGTEFDTYYLMSVVDDNQYGYFTVISGIGLSLTGILASAFITFQISNNMVLLCSQALALMTIIMSVLFALFGRNRLKNLNAAHGDGVHGPSGSDKDAKGFATLRDEEDDGGDDAADAEVAVIAGADGQPAPATVAGGGGAMLL